MNLPLPPALNPAVARVAVRRVGQAETRSDIDALAVEEPLEIRVVGQGREAEHTVAVTMRTPGHDVELALGFLQSEGILVRRDDVVGAAVDPTVRNLVRVRLGPGVPLDLVRLARHSFVSSSCGVCGKTAVDAVRARRLSAMTMRGGRWSAAQVLEMPAALRRAQAAFEQTGGLHAAGLFDEAGALELVREDVGRHNAVDKLVGASFLAARLPLGGRMLVLSGRASFELVQKAAMAGITAIAAVGAPSSLAVELAQSAGITLLGFVRDARFNAYTWPEGVVEAGRG
jgi:FdhD protein